MEKIYTQLDGAYVLPDSGDLSSLKLDSCLVARRKGKLYVHPIAGLKAKEVESGEGRFADPVFGYYHEEGEKTEKFLMVDGVRKDANFCGFCRDLLNGITGNCFNRDFKPKGCSFDPAKSPEEFQISLEGWENIRSWEVNEYSPFKKPSNPDAVSFDQKTIAKNRKARKIRANFGFYLAKKEEKFCSRCIWKGLCTMTSAKIAERCMVTEEKTLTKCLRKIGHKFGSVEEYLNRLAYSGEEILWRPKAAKRRTRWLILKPEGRNHFIVRKPSRPWVVAKITRRKIERDLSPGAIPFENREKIASLAWFFLEKYCPKDWEAYRGYRGRTIRILSVRPLPEGILVSYYPYGWRLRRHTSTITSFNDVLRFEH